MRRSFGRSPVLSIRWIVTGVAVVLTTLSVLAVGALYEQRSERELNGQVQDRLLLMARNLALSSSDPLLTDFPEMSLHPLVNELLNDHQEIAFAVVVDHEERIVGHRDARALGAAYAPPSGLSPFETRRVLEPRESLSANGEVLVAEAPVRDLGGRPIGRALVAMQRSYVAQLLAASRRQLLVALGLVVIVGVAAGFVLMSLLLRPVSSLREGLVRIGKGDLETPIPVRDRTELGLLAQTVNDMATELRGAQMQMIERERLAHEVGLARRIQQSLLPAGPTQVHGVEVLGNQRAAAEVGGDYYDILPLADGRVALTVADVAGKGLAGCLVMTMISALIRAYRELFDSPAALLAALDERLSESLQPGVFVTMFYGILDPVRGDLVFASAGHNPMLVYRKGTASVETIGSTGIPLAAIRNGAIVSTLKNQSVHLEPGDVLVEYTDGLSEAPNRTSGEEFGHARLEGVTLEHATAGTRSVLEALSGAIRDWTGTDVPSDDETLLIVRRSAASEVPVEPETPMAGDAREALTILEEAQAAGQPLRLPARLDAMAGVLRWLAGLSDLQHLAGKDAKILGTALYEACANIAEHGYGEDPSQSFEVWWIPPSEPHRPDVLAAGDPVVLAADTARRGRFVIRDRGKAFRPLSWSETDFSRREVWRQGRGFGLDILHRAMRRVDYHPNTPQGNITVLVYGPRVGALSAHPGGSS